MHLFCGFPMPILEPDSGMFRVFLSERNLHHDEDEINRSVSSKSIKSMSDAQDVYFRVSGAANKSNCCQRHHHCKFSRKERSGRPSKCSRGNGRNRKTIPPPERLDRFQNTYAISTFISEVFQQLFFLQPNKVAIPLQAVSQCPNGGVLAFK